MSVFDFLNNGVLALKFSEEMYLLDDIAELIRKRRVGKRMLSQNDTTQSNIDYFNSIKHEILYVKFEPSTSDYAPVF